MRRRDLGAVRPNPRWGQALGTHRRRRGVRRAVTERRGPKRRSYSDRSVGGRCVYPRDGAPVVSGRSADPRHEAHQHEVRELDDVRHGDRIRKFYADRGGALHEFEMVVGEDWVKAGEVPQFGLQIRSVGQEITKRIAGEASPQPLFEAKKRPATRAAAVRALASFSSEIQMVVDRLGGQPGFLESRTMVDAARSWPGAQLSRLSFDHGPDAFARGRSGPHRNHPLTQAGGFRPDFLLFPAAL